MSPSRPLSRPLSRPPSVSRRRALAGAGTLGLGLPVLSACGDDGTPTAADPSTSTPSSASSAPSSSAATAEPAPTTGAAPTGAGVVSTADVPVGGGVVLADEGVVVTQPAAGDIKVFSSTCTHNGCPVSEVSDGVIICPCHQSHFDITTGDVVQPPATEPLAAVDFTVDGDQVVLA